MKSASRRSLLQVRILLRLEQGPARTVSELAVVIGARRPSVSRSLKTLRNDKLVERRRNGWTLTSAGEEEAKRRNQELSRVADNLRRTFKGVASLELMKAGNLIPQSLVGGVVDGVLAKTMGSTSIAALASANLGRLPDVVTHSVVPGDMVAQSLAQLAETQRTLWGVIPLFRDFLRTNPEKARQYEDLKRDLMARLASDPPAYNAGKASFIESIVQRVRCYPTDTGRDSDVQPV